MNLHITYLIGTHDLMKHNYKFNAFMAEHLVKHVWPQLIIPWILKMSYLKENLNLAFQ